MVLRVLCSVYTLRYGFEGILFSLCIAIRFWGHYVQSIHYNTVLRALCSSLCIAIMFWGHYVQVYTLRYGFEGIVFSLYIAIWLRGHCDKMCQGCVLWSPWCALFVQKSFQSSLVEVLGKNQLKMKILISNNMAILWHCLHDYRFWESFVLECLHTSISNSNICPLSRKMSNIET